jgi:hypothetical protein
MKNSGGVKSKAVRYVYFIPLITMKTFNPRSSKLRYKHAEELLIVELLSKMARLSSTCLRAYNRLRICGKQVGLNVF